MRAVTFWIVVVLAAGAGACDAARPQESKLDRAAKVRNDRKHFEALGSWIYDDFPRALAEAKSSGKPLLVVFRCIPCEACAKLDEDVVAANAAVKALLEKFVCCRMPRANGMDLAVFQFDFDQSWAGFMLNADQTIYGRYGTRSHQTRSEDDVSVEGFAKALEGALALHARHPADRPALAAKTGPTPPVPTPEKFPSLADRFRPALDWEGNVAKSCLHCHWVGEAQRLVFRAEGRPMPAELLHPYPDPRILGLFLDPKEKARVVRIAPGSAAEKAGFKAGDELTRLQGQPLLSIADVQWVLHHAGDSASLRADVARGGEVLTLDLDLAPGWRGKGDLSWRASSWDLRRMTTGGLVLEQLPDADAARLGIPNAMLALRATHVGGFGEHAAAKSAGFRLGDVLVKVADRSDRMSESDLMAFLVRTTKRGDQVPVTVNRAGQKVELRLPMQ